MREDTAAAARAPDAGAAASGDGSGRHAVLVAAGILLSRVAGLVRQTAFAHFFGTAAAADAFNAAFRIPNFLQNLFGEGALSASFIPVYAGLLKKGDNKEADRVAGAVGAILALATTALVLVGVLAAPWLVAVLAPGFSGDTEALTIRLVRVLFPGAGLLVLSAWCLGVLNSHRRFLLSYAAPVAWNAAMIAALIGFGPNNAPADLAVLLAWASVVGSALQLLVQMPTVLTLARHLRPVIDVADENVRTAVRNFGPAFVSRGVVQISAYVDTVLASWLPTGSVATLMYAQTLYTLPVSLFGIAVSAAALPAMSGDAEADPTAPLPAVAREALRARLDAGLGRIAFFVVPSAVAFLALGDVVAQALFQTGRFSHDDALHVWATLAGSAVGLLASTLGRLYASAFYALKDTRTPLWFAVIRVALTTGLGAFAALVLPDLLGVDHAWGLPGLTASAGAAGWVEFVLLRRALNRRIGTTGVPLKALALLWAAALAAAAAGFGVKLLVAGGQPQLVAALVLGAYGVVYFAVTGAAGVPHARALFGGVVRRLRRR